MPQDEMPRAMERCSQEKQIQQWDVTTSKHLSRLIPLLGQDGGEVVTTKCFWGWKNLQSASFLPKIPKGWKESVCQFRKCPAKLTYEHALPLTFFHLDFCINPVLPLGKCKFPGEGGAFEGAGCSGAPGEEATLLSPEN